MVYNNTQENPVYILNVITNISVEKVKLNEGLIQT